MMFIVCVQYDNKSENICMLCSVYTCALSTDGLITLMCAFMLLALYNVLPYWIIVCAYMLCVCYVSIWIFIVYGCILYSIEYLYHFPYIHTYIHTYIHFWLEIYIILGGSIPTFFRFLHFQYF